MQIDKKVSEYLLELIRCGVSDRTPEEKPEDVDWKKVYDMAKRHGLTAMSYYAIGKLRNKPDEQLMQKWKTQNAKLLVKCINQENETRLLSEAFEKNEVPYMLLKGSVLRSLFHTPYLREMSDIDILIPKELEEKACDIVGSIGYEFIASVIHHVELQKPPYMTLELHTNLIGENYSYHSYYKDPWFKARLTDGSYGYSLSNEDFYLFLLTHAAKHYYNSGTGIRSVLDVYVFNRAYRDSMDRDYLAAELKKLELTDFAAQIEELAQCWFSEEKLPVTDRVKDMQYYILSSATYGTSSNRNVNTIRKYMEQGKSEKSAKRAMFLHMAFLPRDEMISMFPVLKKAPVLLPFCWIVRWIRILVTKPQSISSSYQYVQDIHLYGNEDDAEKK